MSELGQHKRDDSLVELEETPADALSVNDSAAERSTSGGAIARGLLLIALGAGSHLWIDATRGGVATTPEVAPLAAVTSVNGEPPDVVNASASDNGASASTSRTGAEDTAPLDSAAALMLDEVTSAGALNGTAERHDDTRRQVVGTSGVVSRRGGDGAAAPVRAVERAPVPREVAAAPENAGASSAATITRIDDTPRLPLASQVLVPLPARRTAVTTLDDVDIAPVEGIVQASTRRDAPARSAARSIAAEEQLIRSVLEQYQRAFNELDVRAASSVYPAVDRRALARAFSHLEAQSITLQDCGVTLASTAAHARCRGVATYMPKVGRGPLRYTREWNFRLARTDSDWRIQSVH